MNTAVETIRMIRFVDERNSKSMGRFPFLVIVAQKSIAVVESFWLLREQCF